MFEVHCMRMDKYDSDTSAPEAGADKAVARDQGMHGSVELTSHYRL